MPVGIQTIPIWVGVDPASGQDIYKGLDGNNYTVAEAAAQAGSLNNFLNANRVPFGKPYPDFTGSFSSSLNYKNWYMNTLWNFAVGQTYIASGEQIQGKYAFGSMDITPLRSQLGRWRNPGDVTRVAQVTTAPTIWGRTSEYVSEVKNEPPLVKTVPSNVNVYPPLPLYINIYVKQVWDNIYLRHKPY